jgi:hypothetical protein
MWQGPERRGNEAVGKGPPETLLSTLASRLTASLLLACNLLANRLILLGMSNRQGFATGVWSRSDAWTAGTICVWHLCHGRLGNQGNSAEKIFSLMLDRMPWKRGHTGGAKGRASAMAAHRQRTMQTRLSASSHTLIV